MRGFSWRAVAVWRRDFDVYLKTWWTNLLPPILEPLLYLVAFGGAMGGMIGQVGWRGANLSYAQFLAPGLIAVSIMFWAVFETLYGSFVRMYYQKTFDAIVATPLSLDDVIVGEILWGATKAVLVSAIMLVVIGILGLASFPGCLWVLPFSLLAGLLFASLGMCFTAICPTIDAFNLPIFSIVFPMFLFSGTFFPVERLPGWARMLAGALPLTHTSTFVRAVCLGRVDAALWGPVLYTAGVGFVLFWLALALMRRRLVR